MTRTRLLAALVAGLTLAGAGTAATALADDPASTAALVPAHTAADTTILAGPPTTGPTADDAGRTAVGHLGGGSVVKVEREVEHGRTTWGVDVRRGTATARVHVDAATGAVTRVEPGRDDRSGSRSTADRHGGDLRGGDDGPGHDRSDDRGGDDRGGDDRGGDDRTRHGGDRRGDDDGPGHDRGADH
jgi:hypothetical protein